MAWGMATLDAGVVQRQNVQFTYIKSRMIITNTIPLGGNRWACGTGKYNRLPAPYYWRVTMIKTEEYLAAIERRRNTARPRTIRTKEYLPLTLEFVPIITRGGQVMRGHLQMGDGIIDERELLWICQPMNHGPGEKTLKLDEVSFWIG